MGFNTWPFLIYLLLTWVVYWLIPKNPLRVYFLILAGLFFVLYHFPLNILVYLIFSISIFLISRFISPKKKKSFRDKIFLAAGISLSLFLLLFYKYRLFIFKLLVDVGLKQAQRSSVSGEFFQYLIPIGISFFVFEAIHYLVEIYKSNIKKPRLRDFLLFMIFFPTLTAGPIKRFNNFKNQIGSLTFPRKKIISQALRRIILGLAKKVLLADFLVMVTNLIFTDPAFFSPWQHFLATYFFSMVIFLDFSGYSDVAIGTSRLFGFKVPENFNSPYTKPNISAFWESWHISLTSWIRDYLFIPLGGSRVGFRRYLLNVLLVFTAVGLWHGASWNFVFWGIYHGLGVCLYQIYKNLTKRQAEFNQANIISQVASTFITFNFVSFGWVLFKMNFFLTFSFWKEMLVSRIGLVFLGLNLVAISVTLLKPEFGKNWKKKISQLRQKALFMKSVAEKEIFYFKLREWSSLLLLPVIIYFLILFFSESPLPYIYEQF